MKNIYIKPYVTLLTGIILAEVSLSVLEDPCCVKETDVPSESRPYLPPAYTLGAIVASTASSGDIVFMP